METLDAILAFLDDIGIPAREGPVPADSVLPGIRLVSGTLVYDRAALRWPGDLLHEAGHIAVTPAALRPVLSDALEVPVEAPHAGEVEATAWAYAATVQLRLPPAVLFHDGGYRGHSAGLIMSFGCGVYPGAFGLAQAGMTLLSADARLAGVPPYPHMTRWLRE
ncbi:MAG TPA: hypothetical protein VD866_16745 [Urbifossiella sp.]|nr:hypothetical protein [Urbifossiella sp.]